eukprot:4464268-Pyramimonas_sp.AAC.1
METRWFSTCDSRFGVARMWLTSTAASGMDPWWFLTCDSRRSAAHIHTTQPSLSDAINHSVRIHPIQP